MNNNAISHLRTKLQHHLQKMIEGTPEQAVYHEAFKRYTVANEKFLSVATLKTIPAVELAKAVACGCSPTTASWDVRPQIETALKNCKCPAAAELRKLKRQADAASAALDLATSGLYKKLEDTMDVAILAGNSEEVMKAINAFMAL